MTVRHVPCRCCLRPRLLRVRAWLQVPAAVAGGASHLLLICSHPLPPREAQALDDQLTADGVTAAAVVLSTPVLMDASLLQYALLQAQRQAGLPRLGAVLALPASEPPTQQPVAAAGVAALAPAVSDEVRMAGLIGSAISDILGGDVAGSIGADDPLLTSGAPAMNDATLPPKYASVIVVRARPSCTHPFNECTCGQAGTSCRQRCCRSSPCIPAVACPVAGINSTAAVAVTGRLEAALGVSLPPTLVFDYPSIRDMSAFLSSNYGAAAAAGAVQLPAGAALPADPEASMAALVLRALDDILGSDVAAGIDAEAPLMTSGVNSTAAVAVTGRLEAALGVSLPPTLVFDYPSIRDMSAFLSSNYCAAVAPAAAAAAVPTAAAAPGLPAAPPAAAAPAAARAVLIVGMAQRMAGGSFEQSAPGSCPAGLAPVTRKATAAHHPHLHLPSCRDHHRMTPGKAI